MTEPQKEDTDACMACLDRFMAAVNAHDVTAMEREMHFPHARIAADTVVTYAAPGANPMDLFERLMRNDGWQRSRWISRPSCRGTIGRFTWPCDMRASAPMAASSATTTRSTSSHAALDDGVCRRDRASDLEGTAAS